MNNEIEKLIDSLYVHATDKWGNQRFVCHEDEIEAELTANWSVFEADYEAGEELDSAKAEHDAEYLVPITDVCDDAEDVIDWCGSDCIVTDHAAEVLAMIKDITPAE